MHKTCRQGFGIWREEGSRQMRSTANSKGERKGKYHAENEKKTATDKLARKIKLKKRLDKAYKKLGMEKNVKHFNNIVKDMETEENVSTIASARIVSSFENETKRPNPYKNALIKQKIAYEQKEEEEMRKDQEIKAKKEQILKTIELKKKTYRQLHEKTRKGQPNLNKQMDFLLEKIVKNTTNCKNN